MAGKHTLEREHYLLNNISENSRDSNLPPGAILTHYILCSSKASYLHKYPSSSSDSTTYKKPYCDFRKFYNGPGHKGVLV